MNRTKKMTLKYWKSLDEGSRKRALTCVYPLMPSLVEMLLKDDNPDPRDDCWWEKVFRKVRQPIPSEYDKKVGYMHYKTVVDGRYIP